MVYPCHLKFPMNANTPAKFHLPSLSGSASTSKTGIDRPTEFAIAICHLVNTKCHN